MEGGVHHGVRDQAGRGDDVAAEAERMLPPPVLRLRTGRSDHRICQKAGPVS